jgi:hypothetical protein
MLKSVFIPNHTFESGQYMKEKVRIIGGNDSEVYDIRIDNIMNVLF